MRKKKDEMYFQIAHDITTGRYFAFQILEGKPLLAGYLGFWDKKPRIKELREVAKVKGKEY